MRADFVEPHEQLGAILALRDLRDAADEPVHALHALDADIGGDSRV